jgi:hypothetical protein
LGTELDSNLLIPDAAEIAAELLVKHKRTIRALMLLHSSATTASSDFGMLKARLARGARVYRF